jgi:hypothetical protein
MIISKSDYIKYYQCPKLLWLYKNRKDLITEDIDEQMKWQLESGEAVEAIAYSLFPDGLKVPGGGFQQAIDNTTAMIMDKKEVLFQASFWNDDLFCRTDIIKKNSDDNTWENYEVKSATSVKKEYIPDLAFQKLALRVAGLKVVKSYVIHVNNEYVRQGEIDAKEYLTTEDVSAQVDSLLDEVNHNIDNIIELLKKRQEPEVRILKQCNNPYECMFKPYCWQNIPKHSIYNVYPSETQLNTLLDKNIIKLKDMPAEAIGNEKYLRYYNAHLRGKPLVNKLAIKKELAKYKFPIYFLDYETNGGAVPMFDGYRPYQQVPFQYSLHVLESPESEVKHFEYLALKNEDPVPGLAKALSTQIGPDGSVVAWFMGFEKGRNKEMAKQCPEYAGFFQDINARMLDLMDFFKEGYYADENFFGSASLKKVLPIVAPHLAYDDLAIQEGGTASASWNDLIGNELSREEKEKLKQDMLLYCERDTFALVEIFSILNRLINN